MTEPKTTPGAHQPRLRDDAYFTPQALADAIAARLAEVIEPPDLIVEPSAGAGAFVRAARKAWGERPYIYANEPNGDDGLRDALRTAGADDFKRKGWEDLGGLAEDFQQSPESLILGNPPYNLAESHVRLGLERLGHYEAKAPQPRYLCFLLRASFLASKKRAALFAEAPPRWVWNIVGRPSFTGNGKTDGAEYAAIVWQAGHRGPYEGGWLEWK